MAEHVQFTIDTGVQVYFCDPHSPRQRPYSTRTPTASGRQYFPKGTDLSVYPRSYLDFVDRRTQQPASTQAELDDTIRGVSATLVALIRSDGAALSTPRNGCVPPNGRHRPAAYRRV